MCQKTIETDIVDKKPHTEIVISGVAATCITTGLTEGKCCSVCNTVLVQQQIIGKTYHSYSQKNTSSLYLKSEATYFEPSMYYYSCVCGKKGTATFKYGQVLPVSIVVPGTPSEFVNYSNPAVLIHTKAIITSITYKIDRYTDRIKVTFTVEGHKTYDYYNGSHKIIIGMKLVDPRGRVVDDIEIDTPSVSEGDAFKVSGSFYLDEDDLYSGNYVFYLVSIKW